MRFQMKVTSKISLLAWVVLLDSLVSFNRRLRWLRRLNIKVNLLSKLFNLLYRKRKKEKKEKCSTEGAYEVGRDSPSSSLPPYTNLKQITH